MQRCIGDPVSEDAVVVKVKSQYNIIPEVIYTVQKGLNQKKNFKFNEKLSKIKDLSFIWFTEGHYHFTGDSYNDFEVIVNLYTSAIPIIYCEQMHIKHVC